MSFFDCFAAPLHPIPNPWKFQHPFHGRLTSNMLCKRCGQQVRLISLPTCSTAKQKVHFFVGQGRSTARVIVKNTSLVFFLESSTIWLIWKSVPIHSLASVGKSKRPTNGNNIICNCFCLTVRTLMWWFFSGSTCVFRSLSPAFHFFRNY